MKFNNIGIFSHFDEVNHPYVCYVIGNHKKFPEEKIDLHEKIFGYQGYFPLKENEFKLMMESIKVVDNNHYKDICTGFFESEMFYYSRYPGTRLNHGNCIQEITEWRIKWDQHSLSDDEVRTILKHNTVIHTIDQKILAAQVLIFKEHDVEIKGVHKTTSNRLKEYMNSKENENNYVFTTNEILQFLPNIDWHPYKSN